ncbi:MAG: thiamine phosphate synthase [Dehalococcoidia bacterium]|nr:thiamine phosphate synthase [Dehalococcoidia bacterium]
MIPRLLVVADRTHAESDERLLEVLRDLAREPAPGMAIQFRWKTAPAADFRHLAARSREAVPAAIPLFLNGPADLAVELGFDGVHYPEADIPAHPDMKAGNLARSAAVHDATALARAAAAGVHFVVFGPVFSPGSKQAEAAGIDALHAIAAGSPLPIVAIGGITPDRARECVRAGAAGVAALSPVIDAESPRAVVSRYLESIQEVAT